MIHHATRIQSCKKCDRSIKLDCKESICIIIKLSQPSQINISKEEYFQARKILYRSHLEEIGEMKQQAFFRWNNQMHTQGTDSMIYRTDFGLHENVTMVSVTLASKDGVQVAHEVDDFIYGKHIQLKLSKTYMKNLNRDKYELKQQLIKE